MRLYLSVDVFGESLAVVHFAAPKVLCQHPFDALTSNFGPLDLAFPNIVTEMPLLILFF